MNTIKKLIIFALPLFTTQLYAVDLKGFPDVFVPSNSQKNSPQIKIMQGNPPIPIEIKISKPTIVHFWATWCAPCVDELPKLAMSAAQFKKSGIDVIFISIDVSASTKVPPFLSKLGLSDLPIYWDSMMGNIFVCLWDFLGLPDNGGWISPFPPVQVLPIRLVGL